MWRYDFEMSCTSEVGFEVSGYSNAVPHSVSSLHFGRDDDAFKVVVVDGGSDLAGLSDGWRERA